MDVAIQAVVVRCHGEYPEDTIGQGRVSVGLRSVQQASPRFVGIRKVPSVLQRLARFVEATVEYQVIVAIEELALSTSLGDVLFAQFGTNELPSRLRSVE